MSIMKKMRMMTEKSHRAFRNWPSSPSTRWSPWALKLKGTIKGKEVVVMIDSGASHNFISEVVVHQLGLTMEGTTGYGVLVGTGMTVKGEGVCKDVELMLQNCSITTSFLPLELGSADVILGIQWLETLGDMKVNWKLQVMKFKMQEMTVTLKGDMNLCSSAISLKSLWDYKKKLGSSQIHHWRS